MKSFQRFFTLLQRKNDNPILQTLICTRKDTPQKHGEKKKHQRAPQACDLETRRKVALALFPRTTLSTTTDRNTEELHAAVSTSFSHGVLPALLLLVLGIVVPGRPAGVQVEVPLPLALRHLVVLALLLPREGVPLQERAGNLKSGSGGDLQGSSALSRRFFFFLTPKR